MSTIRNIQVDEYRPNFIIGNVKTKLLSDEINMIQLGIDDEFEYHSLEMSSPLPSAWSKYPTADQPDGGYKFSSFVF